MSGTGSRRNAQTILHEINAQAQRAKEARAAGDLAAESAARAAQKALREAFESENGVDPDRARKLGG